jgi:hypothetical protein
MAKGVTTGATTDTTVAKAVDQMAAVESCREEPGIFG